MCVHEVVYRGTSSQVVAQEPYTQVHLETILQKHTNKKLSYNHLQEHSSPLGVSSL